MEQKPKSTVEDTLTVLSIFHYVIGGFQILLSLIGVLYITLGIAMGSGALDSARSSPPPEVTGWLFAGVGLFVTLLFLTLGGLSIKAATNYRKRKNRMFCMVVDGILCLMIPYGTIVGIFGLIMLTKPEAEELFTG